MKLKNNVSFESTIRSFEELYNRSYNALELAELKLCYDNQLPLDKFARLQTHWRMQEARRCLEVGIDLFQHAKECYSRIHLETTRQIAIIGLVLPVERMTQLSLPALIEIRKGLENDIGVSIYMQNLSSIGDKCEKFEKVLKQESMYRVMQIQNLLGHV